jgi:hypothetical protein
MSRRETLGSARAASGRMLQARLRHLCRDRSLNMRQMQELLTEQCHLRIGNAPPTLGKEQVLRELAAFVRSADQIGTGYFDAWTCRNTVILELDCVMTCPRGVRVIVPFSAILRMMKAQVDDIRIYIERSRLHPVEPSALNA